MGEKLKHLVEALKHCYKLERINENVDFDYKGVGTPSTDHICLSPKETFKASNLKYLKENQNREAFEEILAVAFRLGFDEGKKLSI